VTSLPRFLTGVLVLFPTVLPGQVRFVEVARRAGIDHACHDTNRVCGGAGFFDFDKDGYPDLYLTGGTKADKLFRNNGDGTFRDVTKRAGLSFMGKLTTVGVVTGDIDNDGDRDVFVTTAEGFRNVLLRNNGDGTFTDISERAGITGTAWSAGAAFGDYDLDGLLDLYVGNYCTYDAEPYDENLTGGIENQLYRNLGNNRFEEVAVATGVNNPNGLTLGVRFTDFDGDGDLDLYVANDFGDMFEPNAFFRNEYPNAVFTDISKASGTAAQINGMGIAVGDYDEDGDLDFYVTNIAGNLLYGNTGTGTFDDAARARGVDDSLSTSWGVAFLDYDNDTHLDLLLANGRVLPRYNMADFRHVARLLNKHENRLFKGDGTGSLIEVSDEVGIADTTRGRGLAVADIDNDGDLDFFVAVVAHSPRIRARSLLYRNDGGNTQNWLRVSLEGTKSNKDGVGSLVTVVAGGRRLIREIDGGSSYVSHSSTVAHYGLGTLTKADSVIVTWPGGGQDVITNVTANQMIHIVEGSLRDVSSVREDP
jgi:hypothetical protein